MNQRTSRPAEVTFTDPKIETADIVRTFLELATTGFPTSYISGERAILLVKFLLKYDCERTLHNLASFMAVRCVDFRAAATAFMVAAHTNDPNCRRVSSIGGRSKTCSWPWTILPLHCCLQSAHGLSIVCLWKSTADRSSTCLRVHGPVATVVSSRSEIGTSSRAACDYTELTRTHPHPLKSRSGIVRLRITTKGHYVDPYKSDADGALPRSAVTGRNSSSAS